MAVILAQNSRTVSAAIRYVLNPKEGQAKGERYVVASGIGVHPRAAVGEFARVRKRHGKASGFIQGYSLVQGFGYDELDPNSPVAWEKANELGRALAADQFPGHQVIVVTQIDGDGTTGGRNGRGGAIHNHIIINAVNTETGRSIRGSKVTHKRLAKEHDRVLEAHRYGWKNTVELKDHQADRRTKTEAYYPAKLKAWEVAQAEAQAAGGFDAALFDKPKPKEPVEMTLKTRIRQALADDSVDSFGRFIEVCRELGVDTQQRGGKGRGITYALLNDEGELVGNGARKSTTLGADFTMDALDVAVERNHAAQLEKAQVRATAPKQPAPAPAPKSQQVAPAPRRDWRGEILRGLDVVLDAGLFVNLNGFVKQASKAGIRALRHGNDLGYAASGSDRVYGAAELGNRYTLAEVSELAEDIAELRAVAPEGSENLPVSELLEVIENEIDTTPKRSRNRKQKDDADLTPARARHLARERGQRLPGA